MIESVISKEMGGYLLVVSSGTIETLEDWKELDRQEVELMFASDHKKVIVDERGVIHKEEILMVIKLVKQMIDNFPFELRYLRLAVVVDEGSMSIARFWETYSVNRGFNWRAFTAMDKAIAFIGEP